MVFQADGLGRPRNCLLSQLLYRLLYKVGRPNYINWMMKSDHRPKTLLTDQKIGISTYFSCFGDKKPLFIYSQIFPKERKKKAKFQIDYFLYFSSGVKEIEHILVIIQGI